MSGERAIVSAAVVLLHTGLYLAFSLVFIGKHSAEPASDLVLIVPLALTPAVPRPDSSRRSSGPALRPHRALETSSHRSGTQRPPGRIIPLPSPGGQRPHDWVGEAEDVAGEQAIVQVRRDHQGVALASRYHPLPGWPLPGPRFHWDESATHRVEALGGSGVEKLAHINDRCALVFFMIVPFAGDCVLGKIDARGDLLEPLHGPSLPKQPR
jgi:hypothetical protein